MNNDSPPAIPAQLALPAQELPQRVLVPQDVSDAVKVLRTACANWTGPRTMQTTEAGICDVSLGRHADAAMGMTVGIAATLLAVSYVRVCRSAVHAVASSRVENELVYAACAALGALAGLFLAGLCIAALIVPPASSAQQIMYYGSTGLGALVLPAARWLRRLEARSLVGETAAR